jgi:hypothetical protein
MRNVKNVTYLIALTSALSRCARPKSGSRQSKYFTFSRKYFSRDGEAARAAR